MKGNYSVDNLPSLIKQARELSLKGIYKESYDMYRNAMEIVHERIKSCGNQNAREQWLKTGQNIKSEYNEVKEIIELCYTFKMEKREENNFKSNENQFILRDYLDNRQFEKKNAPNDDFFNDKKLERNNSNIPDENVEKKRFERFGGKLPFEHHSERNHSDDNNIGYNNVDNYKPSSKPSVKKQSVPNNKANNKMDVEKKRNYEKPWKTDDKEKKQKNKEDNKAPTSNKR